MQAAIISQHLQSFRARASLPYIYNTDTIQFIPGPEIAIRVLSSGHSFPTPRFARSNFAAHFHVNTLQNYLHLFDHQI